VPKFGTLNEGGECIPNASLLASAASTNASVCAECPHDR